MFVGVGCTGMDEPDLTWCDRFAIPATPRCIQLLDGCPSYQPGPDGCSDARTLP